MTPWDVLGLDASASPADIRRAYARLLRVHRPDEDAQAFQRLHEAYQACLAGWGSIDAEEPDVALAPLFQYESDEKEAKDQAEDGGLVYAEPASHAVDPGLAGLLAPREAFDVEAFLDELVEQFSLEVTPVPLKRWLHAHPALYDIALKQALAGPVLDRLYRAGPLRPAHLQVVFDFFDLEQVHVDTGHPPWVTSELIARGEAVFGVPQLRDPEANEGGSTAWLPIVLIKMMIFMAMAAKGCSAVYTP